MYIQKENVFRISRHRCVKANISHLIIICKTNKNQIFRLGGVPIGVVSVETRTVELSIPADPANMDSEAKVCTVISIMLYHLVCYSEVFTVVGLSSLM